MKTRTIGASVAVAAAFAAPPAHGRVPVPTFAIGFATPSRNLLCNAGPYRGRPLLACTVVSVNQGQKVWAMFATGRVRVGTVRGNANDEVPTLRYGRAWSWRGFRCVSQRRGLTCRNRSRHGFFLSRETHRVF